MIKPNSPCLDCKDRYVGCHIDCEGYKVYEEALEKYHRVVNENKNKATPKRGKWNRNRKDNWLKQRGIRK